MGELARRRNACDAHAFRLLQAEAMLVAFERAEGRPPRTTAELAAWVLRHKELPVAETWRHP